MTFLQLNNYGTSLDDRSGYFHSEWNNVNNFMDLERALYKKCDQIPIIVAQSLIDVVRMLVWFNEKSVKLA